MCCAVDRWQGICGGIFKIHDDLKTYDLISVCEPDCRNFALFPEKISGLYTRFDRPMASSTGCSDVWLSQSPDLKFWGNHNVILETKNVPWVNHKIGPAAPPIKTEKGWLATFHAVQRQKRLGA